MSICTIKLSLNEPPHIASSPRFEFYRDHRYPIYIYNITIPIMSSDSTIQKGRYKHFKGGIFEVLGVALHTETLEKFVLYIHKTEENIDGYWVRPIEMFLGEKELEDGTTVKRFEFVGTEKPTTK